MRAVVLVGGFGTRLRPLTYTVPKPMLPVGHVPIIERLIANLVRGGVTEVTLALGFKPEPFIEAFPDGTCAGARLRYAVEPEPLDTAGAIRFAADAAGIDDTFVVANGDVLTDLDIAALVEFHHAHDAEATLHLIAVDDPSAFGVVALDADGRVQHFVEKPAPGTEPSNLINAGTYVLEPSVLGRIPAAQRVSIERATFPAMVADGRVFAHATDDYWIDTGKPDLYLAANIDLVAGRRSGQSCVGIHPQATVHPSASIAHSIIAADVSVDADVTVFESVVLDGATIGAGAIISNSVVMGKIGAGARVSGSVIGAAGEAGDGEEVIDARRPDPDSP
jgi:mannose-1-phosphate guanylyltransferase